jgi:predicted DNA-binding transcriptional regulator AlpA
LREYQFVMIVELKARQSAKIREVRDALIEAGLLTLDQQAKALGLSRSTTWTILRANHKASGLSASIVNRMLASPQLPPLVRAKVLEYIAERTAGLHGHNKLQLRRFTARLSDERIAAGRADQVWSRHDPHAF